MYTWKWSIGETYYKSGKTNKQTLPKDITISSALLSSFDTNSDKLREELDTKIANRALLPQRGVNPFLQNSYIHDIVNSDIYLKPINTTHDNSKSTEHT
jgi:hypothetical protein